MPTYTIQEVAEDLRVHEQTVKRWIKAGKIKVIRLGHRTIRITEDEFNRIKREGLK
jgi:excisionase family DNA binding protein